MNSFITGSRAYGRPTDDSDIDLVIRCDTDAEKMLRAFSESEKTISVADKCDSGEE